MKEQRASIKIQITLDNLSPEISSNVGNTIFNALKPETTFLTSSEKISIVSDNGVISIDISANDLQSLRAIVNTYIRLLSLSFLSLNL
ncbi:MAG TPA: KEOPS complex subunit Pcc1 [Nitrososphaeraceae archaeon]|nr:KEOPS complex subunit Pcc1 [Nitrososphaeraceae archaeon]